MFLTQALDPFHDLPTKSHVGWADSEDAPSVIRKIVQTETVAGVGFDTPWDCSMVLFPWMHSHSFSRTNCFGNRVITPGTDSANDNVPLGMLQCFCAEAGTPLDMSSANFEMQFNLNQITRGRNRLVGVGFEVVNTTPQLYKGGAVTCWRQGGAEPNGSSAFVYDVNPVATETNSPLAFDLERYPTFPLTSNAAALIPDSKTWEAQDGVYIVGSFNTTDNPACNPEPKGAIFSVFNDNEPLWAAGVESEPGVSKWAGLDVGERWATTPILGGTTPNLFPAYFPASIMAPINQTGCYFTGLTPQTTLTITLIAYVETFPTSSSELMSMASPSLRENALALQMLSQAFSRLPVAVKAGENPAGEWFARVLEALTPVVTAGVSAAGYGIVNPLLEAGSLRAQQALVGKRPKKAAPQKKNPPARTKEEVKVVINNKPPPLPPRNKKNGWGAHR